MKCSEFCRVGLVVAVLATGVVPLSGAPAAAQAPAPEDRSQARPSEPERAPQAPRRDPRPETGTPPAAGSERTRTFSPSERIPAGASVAFPVDI